MTPVQAFRFLEITAERIGEGPQTGPEVVDAIKVLRGKAARWRLLYLWEHLETDCAQRASAIVGASQNLNAALNGISTDLKVERLGPVALAEAVRKARAA